MTFQVSTNTNYPDINYDNVCLNFRPTDHTFSVRDIFVLKSAKLTVPRNGKPLRQINEIIPRHRLLSQFPFRVT